MSSDAGEDSAWLREPTNQKEEEVAKIAVQLFRGHYTSYRYVVLTCGFTVLPKPDDGSGPREVKLPYRWMEGLFPTSYRDLRFEDPGLLHRSGGIARLDRNGAAIAEADFVPLHPGAEGTFHAVVGGFYALVFQEGEKPFVMLAKRRSKIAHLAVRAV